MYDSQTKSKKWRLCDRLYGSYFKLDKLYKELYSKHFKTHYKGKPTRRYLKIIQQIKKEERFTASDIKNLFNN